MFTLQNRKRPLSRQLISLPNIIREMILEVKITPNSSKNEILRWEENRLVIKIRGIPEKGTVNENLIDFLAKTLGIAKSQIEIVSGRTSSLKKLNIQGVSREQITKLQ